MVPVLMCYALFRKTSVLYCSHALRVSPKARLDWSPLKIQAELITEIRRPGNHRTMPQGIDYIY